MNTLQSFIKTLTVIILLNLSCFLSLHAQQFNHHLKYITSVAHVKSDSVILHYKTALTNAIESSDTISIIESLIALSTLERINLDYSSAITHAGEALFIADNYRDTLLLIKTHEEVGILNYLFKQDSQAYAHFNNAHLLNKILHSKGMITKADLYRSYYNMLLYYQRMSDFENTKAYIDSCKHIARSANMNPMYKVFLNEKEANLYFKKSKYDETLNLLSYSAKTLEGLKDDSDSATLYKSFLIIVYARMAGIYSNLGKYEQAISYYQKSINQPDYFGEHTFYNAYVLDRYASLLNQKGNYADAYKYLLQAKRINDTYLNPRNDDTQGFLSVKDQYGEELRKKNDEINLKNLELATNKQSILKFRIYIIILILVIAILTFLFFTRWLRLKHKKENELNKQKQQQAKELLEHKNKELTSTMLQLIEKEEVIKTLSDHIEKTPANKALLNSIKKQSGNLWDAFNSRFIALNNDFYERLKNKVPDLSAADLKICALIKLNFSGKEMAYLLGISEGSVNVARHRLRKKMNIGRDTNLVQYINSI